MLKDRARARRLALGLHRRQVASQVGVSYETIRQCEAGLIKNPTFIVSYAKALQTTPEWLSGGEEAAAPRPPDEVQLLRAYRDAPAAVKRAILVLLERREPEK